MYIAKKWETEWKFVFTEHLKMKQRCCGNEREKVSSD